MTKTVKGVTYYETWQQASTIANYLGARVVRYERGYAVQRHVSGPYWNSETKTWA